MKGNLILYLPAGHATQISPAYLVDKPTNAAGVLHYKTEENGLDIYTTLPYRFEAMKQ